MCVYIWEIKRVLFCSFCICLLYAPFALSFPQSCFRAPRFATLSAPLSFFPSLFTSDQPQSQPHSLCLFPLLCLPSFPLCLLLSPSGLYIFQCHAIFIQNLWANKIELNMEKEHNENWKFALGFSYSFPLFFCFIVFFLFPLLFQLVTCICWWAGVVVVPPACVCVCVCSELLAMQLNCQQYHIKLR